ncbi:hypothetical protein diail_5358 [Diaporthe ilicicola]|nr:hypothetical protein diail_5358 [Diaporthe ilicicola]
MPDDNEPHGPSNPFIKFKNHVNARIGTGVSFFTGTTADHDKPLGNTQPSTDDPRDPADRHGPDHSAASSPCQARNQPLSGPKARTREIEYWNDWCLVDPYSPHNLRHLPQPTPRDLPSDVRPADFGFHEAFEDLMSASRPSGGYLMDLRERSDLKKEGRVPPSVWIKRLYGDALLPQPLVWERSGLAGGMQVPRAAQGEQPTRGSLDTPLAKALLWIMDGTDGESFSRIEEMLGRDVAEMVCRTRKIADKTFKAFTGAGFEDQASENSHTKTHGDSEPTSGNGDDQPGTEQDLFEMIRSASSEVDKAFSTFVKTMAGEPSPPPERPTRGRPSVSETEGYDASGGKTTMTTSEHVDLFGFIHSKTEFKRLNARGETVEHDTRYSVRSSSDPLREDPARKEADRVRPNKLVPILLTPEQTYAYIRKASDEQLEALRVFITHPDAAHRHDPALKHLQMQLVLLEQQNRKTLANEGAAEEEAVRTPTPNTDKPAPRSEDLTVQEYYAQLVLLEAQNKERLRLVREREEEAQAASEKSQEDTNSKPSGWFWR